MARVSTPYRAPLRSWLSARAPFPQFRSALLDAEAFLGGRLAAASPQAWRDLRAVAGAGDEVFVRLGALLAAQQVRLDVVRVRGEWTLMAVGPAPREASAAVAVAALIEGDAGSRLKRCSAHGCANVYLDWTNGASRTTCRGHTRCH